MPVPFKVDEDIQELGSAAFLKLARLDGAFALAGALFLINGRGEPLEFAYNRIDLPESVLWRKTDLRRYGERKLAASLLGVCAGTPSLVLCLADEAASELFCQDVRLAVPVARIGRTTLAASHTAAESHEAIAHPEPVNLFWYPGPPPADSSARQLLERLVAHGLLLEPFERAGRGLQEAYPQEAGMTG